MRSQAGQVFAGGLTRYCHYDAEIVPNSLIYCHLWRAQVRCERNSGNSGVEHMYENSLWANLARYRANSQFRYQESFIPYCRHYSAITDATGHEFVIAALRRQSVRVPTVTTQERITQAVCERSRAQCSSIYREINSVLHWLRADMAPNANVCSTQE